MNKLLRIIIEAVLGGNMREVEDWLDWQENNKEANLNTIFRKDKNV